MNYLVSLREKLPRLVRSRHADSVLRRRATLLNLITAVLVLGLLVLWGVSLVRGTAGGDWIVNPILAVGLLLVFAGSYVLNTRGYPQAAAYLLLITLVTAVSLNIPTGGVEPAYLLYMIPVTAAPPERWSNFK